MPAIASPFAQFFDTDGTPLNDGRLYFGVVGANPAIQANQIQIFWDAEMTQPAAQPVLTQGGYIYRAGTPATIFCNSRFSMSIYDKNQKLVAYARDAQVSGVFDLAEDLSGPDGASRVGFGSTNVAAELTILAADAADAKTQIDLQAIATGITAEGASTGTVQGVLDAVARATRLRSAMELNQRDVFLLMQGDSTGNEDWEFFYLVAVKIAQLYPTHTVYYRLWNSSTELWESRTLQTGTGPRAIRIYNGSVPGANPIYWQGRLKDKAYDNFFFDLVIVNYGLNTGTSTADQKASISSCLYTLRKDQPDAEILLNIQPPDYTDSNFLNRSQLRVDAQKEIADGFGIACVDAFSMFAQLVNKSNVDDWYLDKIHPNPAGQAKWADLVFGAVLNTPGGQRMMGFGNSPIPNANFSRWAAGFPIWWTTNSTLSRETTVVESGLYAVRCNGFGTGTGTLSFNAQEFIRRMEQSSQLVIYARVRTSGTTDKAGTLYMSRGTVGGGDYAEIRGNNNGFQGIGSGGWRWACLIVPKSFFYAKSNLTIGVFSGESAEYVIVDRVIIDSQVVVPDSSGVDGYRAEYGYDDSSFAVPAKSTVVRNIGGGTTRAALKRGAKLNVYNEFLMPDGVVLTASAITDETTRIAVANTADVSITVPAGSWLVTAS